MLSCRAYSKVFLHPLQQDDASFPTGGQLHTDRIPGFSNTRKLTRAFQCVGAQFERGLWRNGSASDSRSEGWAFESLWPHFAKLIIQQQPGTKRNMYSNFYCDERDHDGSPNNHCVIWENVRMPGVEPGSQAWEACMMPLHYMRLETEVQSLFDGAKQKKTVH